MKNKKKTILLVNILFCFLSSLLCSCANKKVNSQEIPSITEDFIQPWICETWDVTSWESHLTKLKNNGYSTIILQYSAYYENNEYLLYFEDTSFDGYQSPLIENLLQACKNIHFQARIGLLQDVTWWNALHQKAINDWIDYNNKLTKAIYEKFYTSYKEEFKGFYYSFEFYTQFIGYESYYSDLINAEIEILSKLNPNMSLMISPFKSQQFIMSKSAMYFMWKRFFKETNFRDFDIFAPQDGYGSGSKNVSQSIDFLVSDFLQSSMEACKDIAHMQFFINVEMFTNIENETASKERIQHQLEVDNTFLPDGLISFSYSHYVILKKV